MNCFVIMPFSSEFDDVYAVIKSTVENTSAGPNSRCFRLDESRPAGRITDRLLGELQAATVCVADITDAKPNVMWELGYAMALDKPTILVTQSLEALPFDIKDMQAVRYERARLNASLAGPLRRCLLDTLGGLGTSSPKRAGGPDATQTVGRLLEEISHLKEMVAEAVGAWKQSSEVGASQKDLQRLAGDWLNRESGSHIYARMVGGELIAPYCYGGNDHLTGVYFGWRRTGDFWFARYKWIDDAPKGFTFLREESLEELSGAWWSSEDEVPSGEAPPKSAGVPSSWHRRPSTRLPKWASAFLASCEKEGIATAMARSV